MYIHIHVHVINWIWKNWWGSVCTYIMGYLNTNRNCAPYHTCVANVCISITLPSLAYSCCIVHITLHSLHIYPILFRPWKYYTVEDKRITAVLYTHTHHTHLLAHILPYSGLFSGMYILQISREKNFHKDCTRKVTMLGTCTWVWLFENELQQFRFSQNIHPSKITCYIRYQAHTNTHSLTHSHTTLHYTHTVTHKNQL